MMIGLGPMRGAAPPPHGRHLNSCWRTPPAVLYARAEHCSRNARRPLTRFGVPPALRSEVGLVRSLCLLYTAALEIECGDHLGVLIIVGGTC